MRWRLAHEPPATLGVTSHPEGESAHVDAGLTGEDTACALAKSTPLLDTVHHPGVATPSPASFSDAAEDNITGVVGGSSANAAPGASLVLVKGWEAGFCKVSFTRLLLSCGVLAAVGEHADRDPLWAAKAATDLVLSGHEIGLFFPDPERAEKFREAACLLGAKARRPDG